MPQEHRYHTEIYNFDLFVIKEKSVYPFLRILHTHWYKFITLYNILNIYCFCYSTFKSASYFKHQQKVPPNFMINVTAAVCRSEISYEEHKGDITRISIKSLAWLYVQFLFLHFPHLSRSVLVPWTVANWASLIASFKNLFRRLFISSLAISCRCA